MDTSEVYGQGKVVALPSTYTTTAPSVVTAAAGRQHTKHAAEPEFIRMRAHEVILHGSSVAKYDAVFLKYRVPPLCAPARA
jgi:hypothetical protein